MAKAPECPTPAYEWIQRSADPRSKDMEVLGGGRWRGRQRVVNELQKKYDGDVISNLEKTLEGKGGVQ